MQPDRVVRLTEAETATKPVVKRVVAKGRVTQEPTDQSRARMFAARKRVKK